MHLISVYCVYRAMSCMQIMLNLLTLDILVDCFSWGVYSAVLVRPVSIVPHKNTLCQETL